MLSKKSRLMKSNIPCFHSYVENKQSKIDDDDGGGT
jgi:hypothetical protein